MPICWCYMICLTREEKDTKSFGGSGSSDGGRESPESEAGVRGLGLQVFGFGFGFLRLKKRSVLQQLMHTRASAASRSVYSRPEQSKPNPLESECSLSCLLLFTLTSQASIFSVWGGGENLITFLCSGHWQHTYKHTKLFSTPIPHYVYSAFLRSRLEGDIFLFYEPEWNKKKKILFPVIICSVTLPVPEVPGPKRRGCWWLHPTPCTASGPKPGHLPWPNIDQTVTCCRDEPCEIPIKWVCIRK